MKAKLLMTFLMLGALVAAGTVTAAAQSKADEKAVMDTLELMAKATIAKDVATLDNIYGDEVTYSHSTSATQTKTQVLADIKGPTVAEFMRFSETTIRLYGSVAVVKGIRGLPQRTSRSIAGQPSEHIVGSRASCSWPARLANRRASDHEDRAVNRHARHEVDVRTSLMKYDSRRGYKSSTSAENAPKTTA